MPAPALPTTSSPSPDARPRPEALAAGPDESVSLAFALAVVLLSFVSVHGARAGEGMARALADLILLPGTIAGHLGATVGSASMEWFLATAIVANVLFYGLVIQHVRLYLSRSGRR